MAIDDKTLEKWRKQDIELHKRIVRSWLRSIGAKLLTINKFFNLYDHYIDHTNISCFFHLHSKVFINALITNRLDKVSNYNHKPKVKRRKKNVPKKS